MSTGKINPLDAVRPAGRMFRGRDESVAYCLSMPERPPTSDASARYRSVKEPGQRVRHPGFREDPIPDAMVHGSVDRRPPVHSADVLNVSKPPMAEMMDRKAEAAYYKRFVRSSTLLYTGRRLGKLHGPLLVVFSAKKPQWKQLYAFLFGTDEGGADVLNAQCKTHCAEQWGKQKCRETDANSLPLVYRKAFTEGASHGARLKRHPGYPISLVSRSIVHFSSTTCHSISCSTNTAPPSPISPLSPIHPAA